MKIRYMAIEKFFKVEFDYSKDEYINLGKREKFFATEAELEDFWRKRIKLEFMQRQKTAKNEKDKDSKIKDRIDKRFERLFKQHKSRVKYEPFEMFLDSVGRALGPHSNHLSLRERKDFEVSTRLSFFGIGAVLKSEGGLTIVQKLVVGGPADRSGELKVKDQIIAVKKLKDKENPFINIIDRDLREVVSYIRGDKGTTVVLKILRNGKEILISIVRDEVKLEDQAVKYATFKMGDRKIGIIDIPSFYIDFRGRLLGKVNYRSSSRDVKNALKELKRRNVDAVIIDLRSNGGGSLDEGVRITGFFTGQGPVVYVKKKDESAVPRNYYDNPYFYKPMIVLVDRLSASASEIFSRAIYDYERGLVIGDDTYGKGTVQNLLPIGSQAVKVTIRKFFGPGGSSTQTKGFNHI